MAGSGWSAGNVRAQISTDEEGRSMTASSSEGLGAATICYATVVGVVVEAVPGSGGVEG